MDAFAHCLEAYCGPFYHPLADGIALEGMRLVKENLPRAAEDGSDIAARANMMSAAAMGATAFQKALGAIHSLSHPIGSLHHTHHGMTNAVFMPYVLKFNRRAIEEKLTRVSAYLGLRRPGFASFLDYTLDIRETLGVPHDLPGLGVKNPDIGLMAKMAPLDPTAGGNPVPLTEKDAARLFEQAMAGKL
jgi:alcohol dehydrogenase